MDMVGILIGFLGAWCRSEEFGRENELCVLNTWSKREEKRKVTFRMGDETDIDCVLTKKEHQSLIQNVKAIPGES